MMDRLLANDTALKIISVLVAIILWVSANSGRVQTIRRTVTGVPLEWTPPGNRDLTVLSLRPSSVSVEVQGQPQAVSKMNAAQLAAWVSLSRLTHSGTYALPVVASIPSGASLVGVIPSQVLVEVETTGTRSLQADISISGDAAAGYEVQAVVPTSAAVTVSGPSNYLARVARVAGVVQLSGQSRSFTQNVVLDAVDAGGQAVPHVTVKPSVLQVAVTVRKRPPEVRLPVVVRYSGQPATGYRITGITVNPPQVTVSGTATALAPLKQILTRPIDIGGAKAPVSTVAPLSLPPGVSVVQGSDSVQVSIGVAPG